LKGFPNTPGGTLPGFLWYNMRNKSNLSCFDWERNMRNYYFQIHEYLQRLTTLVVQTDRNEINQAGISVNLMEYALLQELKRREGQTFQEIMESTGRSRNEVTAMVRRLIKQQLIQKEPASEDRRVRRLILTKTGSFMVKKIEMQSLQMLTGILDDFSINEEKAVLKFLVKLDMLTRNKEIEGIRKQVAARMKIE
jgi:DNA-binding MarR family transcriptional regulator